jgi:hypothetical protein
MCSSFEKTPGENLPNSFLVSVFLISASSLLFEINLTRLFSVAHFYHFAFMVVSLALLGYAISGSFLQMMPKMGTQPIEISLSRLSTATGIFYLAAYLTINWLPFDSFSVMWDFRQILRFSLHYFLLTIPFFLSGLVMGIMLSRYSAAAGRVYAFNLTGASFGCVLALLLPQYFGSEGTVGVCSFLVIMGTFSLFQHFGKSSNQKNNYYRIVFISFTLCIFILSDLVLRATINQGLDAMTLRISPYKSLTYAQQYPDAKTISMEWNAFSRVDVISSSGIRSIPGLSFVYPDIPPSAKGILLDGDNLSPVIAMDSNMDFTRYTLTAAGFESHPEADLLVLDSRGGLDILIGINESAKQITAVEPNPLIIKAVPEIYQHPKVITYQQTGRSFLEQTQQEFDLIIISLSDAYHPVSSGAYSLGEDYRYTVEAYQSALNALEEDGFLMITRWLQNPPSETLRSFSTAVSALENQKLEPEERIFAFRSFNIATLLIKQEPFSDNEIQQLKLFAEERAFDLIYYPGIKVEEANRFSILQTPIYYEAFAQVINSETRQKWIENYPFDIRPPTDNHPFFFHFFRFEQLPQLITSLGKTWEPFGGAGFIVILILLVLVTTLSILLIAVPAITKNIPKPTAGRQSGSQRRQLSSALGFFGLIGLGYFFIEIPLIQKLILYLDHPSYAITTVLFTLLLFSGIGSQLSGKVRKKTRLYWILPVTLLLTHFLITALINHSLGAALWIRGLLAFFSLAPLGLLMGIPLPTGISILEKQQTKIIPWVWSINGAASVIASILAMLFALFWGFNQVYWIGFGCYSGSWLFLQLLEKS